MDLIIKALNKAYELHKDQKRKVSNAPYFVHLIDTAKYLMYETDKKEVICAGILHDTLEDTTYAEEELEKDFGKEITKLVKFCTEEGNNHNSTKEEQKNSWEERKIKTLKKLEKGTEEELLVFCADKISTLLSIKEDIKTGNNIWEHLNGTKEKVKWYYTEIEKILEKKLKTKRILIIYKDLLKIFNEEQ